MLGNNPGISPTVAVNDTPPEARKKTLLPGSIDASGRNAILQWILSPISSTLHLSPSFIQYDIPWHISEYQAGCKLVNISRNSVKYRITRINDVSLPKDASLNLILTVFPAQLVCLTGMIFINT